jgi:Zn-dependent protease with chaperone function
MNRPGTDRSSIGSAREQRRRRLVLLGIGALLLLAMSPLFGHHISHETDALFRGRDHVGAFCLIALHEIAAPVHLVFHVLFVTGVAYALRDRLQAWRSVRRTLGLLVTSAPARGGGIWAAARAAGLAPARVRVATGLPTPAFTVGWLRPRVYVSPELETVLSAEELTAVLAHEAEHVRQRDPLRLSVLRFVSHTLFWLPALRRLADDFADEAEIRADTAAAAGRPLVLASAILALAGWSQPRPQTGGVAFDERDLLERRVRRLAGEETAPRSHLTRRSILAGLAALLLVWVSGTAVAHPLPDGRTRQEHHCYHPDGSATSHLVCAAPLLSPARPCPHAGRI